MIDPRNFRTKPGGSIPEQVLDLAVAIQQIPAPTFAEGKRAAFVQQQMLAEGLLDVCTDRAGNVYGRLAGQGLTSPLVVSAHLDTVFPMDTSLVVHRTQEQISGPGIGDNSMGLAGLFGLLWMLRQAQPQSLPAGDIWFVANTGEEGLGDLCGMRAVVDRFGDRVQAYLILEGMSLGQIYHRGLGVQRYKITVRTRGGHSWVNYGRPSAIHHLAHLVTRLDRLALPKQPRTSLNVGVITGGTSVNTIASEAYLELDLRSEDAAALQDLACQVEGLVEAANNSTADMPVAVDAEIIGRRPVGMIPVDHPLVSLAIRCIEAEGLQPKIGIGSTDANIPLSLGIPAICVGLTFGNGAHTIDETIQTGPLASGLRQLLALVQGVQTL